MRLPGHSNIQCEDEDFYVRRPAVPKQGNESYDIKPSIYTLQNRLRKLSGIIAVS